MGRRLEHLPNVALPPIAGSLLLEPPTRPLVLTSYLVSNGIILAAGRVDFPSDGTQAAAT